MCIGCYYANYNHSNKEDLMFCKKNDEGASLIIILVVFSGLLLMVGALLPYATSNVMNSAHFKGHVDKSYAADGGLKQAVAGMKASAFVPDGTGNCSSLFTAGYDLNGQHVSVSCGYDNTAYPKPGRYSTGCTGTGSSQVSPPSTCYNVYGSNTAVLTDTSGSPIPKAVDTSGILVPSGDLDVVFLVDTTNSMSDSSNDAIAELKKDSTLSTIFSGIPATAQYMVAQYRDFTSPTKWSDLPYTTSSWMDSTATKTYIQAPSFTADSTLNAQNENREADLYGLYRAVREVPWHSGSTKAIVWIGDAPGNSPICKALDPVHIAVPNIDRDVVGSLLPTVQLFSVSISSGNTDRLNQSGTGNEYPKSVCPGNGDNSQNQADFLISKAHSGSQHFPKVVAANIGPSIQTALASLKPALVQSSLSSGSCATVSASSIANPTGIATFDESFTATLGMSGLQNCDVTFNVYDSAGVLKATYTERNQIKVIATVPFNFTATIGGKTVARTSATYNMFTRQRTLNSWHLI
jgi:hypothetical protein